jgi:acyl carrier protein
MTVNEALQEHVCGIVATTFGLAPEQVGTDASTQTLRAWTSLAHLRLMASIQQAFGLRLTMDEMIEMTSIEAIERVLTAHGIEAQ